MLISKYHFSSHGSYCTKDACLSKHDVYSGNVQNRPINRVSVFCQEKLLVVKLTQ